MCKAKAYLLNIKMLDVNINSKLNDLHALRTMVTNITSTISPVCVSGSGNQDKLGNAVAKIVDLQNEINRKVDKYVDLKREAIEILEQIQDSDQMKVLHKRYFEYKPWEMIACEMGYSYRNVLYIHGDALQAVDAILKERRQVQ